MAVDLIMLKKGAVNGGSKGVSDPKSHSQKSGHASTHSQRSGASKPPSALRPEQRIPIILVPAAVTSLITLYNAQLFFEKEKFETTDSLLQSGAQKVSPVVVKRINPHTGAQLTCHVMDSADRLKPEDWKRVVAIFTNGQKWQFKGWKWEEPVDIFNNGQWSF
jgi:parafibromin